MQGVVPYHAHKVHNYRRDSNGELPMIDQNQYKGRCTRITHNVLHKYSMHSLYHQSSRLLTPQLMCAMRTCASSGNFSCMSSVPRGKLCRPYKDGRGAAPDERLTLPPGGAWPEARPIGRPPGGCPCTGFPRPLGATGIPFLGPAVQNLPNRSSQELAGKKGVGALRTPGIA